MSEGKNVVVIAASEADARRWCGAAFADDRVTWVSPRSPHRARGLRADVVLATDQARTLPSTTMRTLLDNALPCLAWKRTDRTAP